MKRPNKTRRRFPDNEQVNFQMIVLQNMLRNHPRVSRCDCVWATSGVHSAPPSGRSGHLRLLLRSNWEPPTTSTSPQTKQRQCLDTPHWERLGVFSNSSAYHQMSLERGYFDSMGKFHINILSVCSKQWNTWRGEGGSGWEWEWGWW